MNETAFSQWESFYVIVGSSAGALIGLQFVVVTLIAERPKLRIKEAGAAFITPSVVHFAVVLFLSAVASAPWISTRPVSILWGLVGVFGIWYAIRVARHMRAQTTYEALFVDTLFYVLLPLVGYLLIGFGAWAGNNHARVALFSVGTATLLLLFVGIRNAWDTATYHVFNRSTE